MTTPVTPTQALVADVLCAMLQVDEVDLGQDFFELGGHSLLAVQVVHELSERTNVPLDLESFFDLGTGDRVAAEIDRRRELSDAAPLFADEGEL